ncbi:Nucleolar protein 58 [Desmophyllum pertusum]|uniref:Nucleolar protein 58 n=1 Tax=Desmophyllum pertusum TaxID=174260 RepID=A0A9W9Z1F7_9CNID|nr:Nucleolar protein 58 [Desmophyllum pertusum]
MLPLWAKQHPSTKERFPECLLPKRPLQRELMLWVKTVEQPWELKTEPSLKMRLKALEDNQLRRISGTGKAKARVDKYENKSVVMAYNPATDSTIATPGKKRKRSEENGESAPADSVPVTPSTPATEEDDGETPAKKSKKEKKKKKKKEEEAKQSDEADEEQMDTSSAAVRKTDFFTVFRRGKERHRKLH